MALVKWGNMGPLRATNVGSMASATEKVRRSLCVHILTVLRASILAHKNGQFASDRLRVTIIRVRWEAPAETP